MLVDIKYALEFCSEICCWRSIVIKVLGEPTTTSSYFLPNFLPFTTFFVPNVSQDFGLYCRISSLVVRDLAITYKDA